MKQLSNEEKQAILGIQRNSLPEFIRRTFSIIDPISTYKHNWHIDLISEYLHACERREIKRLIINIPPRFLKSISCSIAFPAWLLGHNPSEKITCVSYAHKLSVTLSESTRAVMSSDWYNCLFPDTVLRHQTQTELKTTDMGFRMCTSTGGVLTGLGGNYIIVDDPLSVQQAQSMNERDKANVWFDSLSTRLDDKKNGVIIVIMQRLHANDTTGYLLEKGGWEHLKIPLVAEEKTIYHMGPITKEVEEGELLHPTMFGEEEVETAKREMKAYAFSGQCQQNPAPTGGGEFIRDWLQFYKGKLTATNFNTYIMVDPANAKKAHSDYTSMVVVGLGADKNFYVLDWVRDRLNIREREERLFELHEKWKPKYVLYEKYGLMVDVDTMREAMNYRNYRFVITEVGGSMNKIDRILRLQPYFYDGRIWLPEQLIRANYEGKSVDLIEDFIHQEYLTFPVGLHDDMLDSLSRIFDAPTLAWPGDHQFDYYKFAEGFK